MTPLDRLAAAAVAYGEAEHVASKRTTPRFLRQSWRAWLERVALVDLKAAARAYADSIRKEVT